MDNKELEQKYLLVDAECDILHECITELYNHDTNVPVIKNCLQRIADLKEKAAKHEAIRKGYAVDEKEVGNG